MKKSCSYCGGIHDVKFVCPSKPSRTWKADERNELRTRIRKFRISAAWTRKRDEIQERDLRLCQVCIRELYGTLDKYTYTGTSVHHIVPLAIDWEKRLENDNLIVLCGQHHADAERGYIPADELITIVCEQECRKT